MTSYIKWIDELKSTFPTRERGELTDQGIRAVLVSGDFLKAEKVDFLPALKAALPVDTSLVMYGESPYDSVHLYYQDGSFWDRYVIIFCSSEWQKTPEGDRIPRISPIFSYTDPINKTGLICKIRHNDEVTHLCPPKGSGLTPCCNKTPFELPWNNRITEDKDTVSCYGNFTSALAASETDIKSFLEMILEPTSSSKDVVQKAKELKDRLS